MIGSLTADNRLPLPDQIIRHTSQQLSTADGVVGDVEVVPVAAAGNAVANGRSSASSSLLVDASWYSCRVSACTLML